MWTKKKKNLSVDKKNLDNKVEGKNSKLHWEKISNRKLNIR